MHVMFDGPPANIPNKPPAVIVYINGDVNILVPGGTPDEQVAEARKRWPEARILTMSVTGLVPADAYDIEKGDYQVDMVPDLYNIAKQHKVWRPCYYGQLSGVMPSIKEALGTIAGLQREDVRLLVADWDDTTIIPPGYDGKQFTSHALGRNLDESILLPTFFQPAGKPTPPTGQKILRATVEVDPADNEWGIWHIEHIEPTTK